jgi:hypothetical protein
MHSHIDVCIRIYTCTPTTNQAVRCKHNAPKQQARTRADAQVNLGRANYLMDTVMLDESKTWDSIRSDLAALYDAANCPETARLVRGE